MDLEDRKRRVLSISAKYRDREVRARRLFVEDRAISLEEHREQEFEIRLAVSDYFSIPHGSVCFCGSTQLGFSPHKNTLFQIGVSDLDIACIDSELYQYAWTDIVHSTRAFTDQTKFRNSHSMALLKDQMLRRGMINIDLMPRSDLHSKWTEFCSELSRKHMKLFGKIGIAIYMSEYAFCWKQDSVISALVR